VLTDIPGVVCYLDATIFYYHLVGAPALSDDSSDLLTRIERGRVHGVSSSVAVAEATHKACSRTWCNGTAWTTGD
jgi:predicted nucleic acid-binding protein